MFAIRTLLYDKQNKRVDQEKRNHQYLGFSSKGIITHDSILFNTYTHKEYQLTRQDCLNILTELRTKPEHNNFWNSLIKTY